MVQARGCWQTTEHTGDLAIEVEAPSLLDLFATSAFALAGVLAGEESGRPPAQPQSGGADWHDLELDAPDREALLVEWLRELLYIQMSEEALLARSEVRELSDTALKARAAFVPVSNGRRIERELKAVTYHGLEVGRHGDGWQARIVFDI